MTEKKLTVRAFIKIVVFTVLACIGFFGLWIFIFLFGLPLMNFGLSLILSMLMSAITIFAFITILIPPRRGSRLAPSKRQTVGAYVAWATIFVLSLPLIRINPLLFLSYLPTLMAVTFIVIYGTLRRRKEMAQK